jgi:hypothetical protein
MVEKKGTAESAVTARLGNALRRGETVEGYACVYTAWRFPENPKSAYVRLIGKDGNGKKSFETDCILDYDFSEGTASLEQLKAAEPGQNVPGPTCEIKKIFLLGELADDLRPRAIRCRGVRLSQKAVDGILPYLDRGAPLISPNLICTVAEGTLSCFIRET